MQDITIKTIDDYIAANADKAEALEQVREAIKSAAPGAEETISYGMPAFTYHGILVYFGAFKNHIGFYPRVSALEAFKKELEGYKGTKGAVQFPLKKPIPVELIGRMVKFRVEENMKRAE